MTTRHRQLKSLYRQLLDTPDAAEVDLEKSTTIHLDPRTWKQISQDHEAHMDGSIDPYRMNCWRGKMVRMHMSPLLSDVVAIDTVLPTDPVREPFCMYIELIRTNGRRLYLDHPETDKEFL